MSKSAYINAKVYIEKENFAEAVLVDGELIGAVGTNAEILALCGSAEIIDCGGRTLLPGFNDSHLHFLETALLRVKADIAPARSPAELTRICRNYIVEHPEYVKRGMIAGGWNQENFTDDRRMPCKHDLDAISTDIPIFLERVCGHIAAANTPLLKMMGLDESHDGVLYGNDCNIAKNLIPGFDRQLLEKLIMDEMQNAVSVGLTSVQSNDAGTSTNNYDEAFSLIKGIYENGLAPIRYRHQVCFNSLPEFEKYLADEQYRANITYGKMLTLGPLKLFRDGSFGAGTALMRDNYPESGTNGLEWMDSLEFDRYVELADKAGMQVITHAIGDLAVKRTAESYARHIKNGRNTNRHAVVHCSVTPPDVVDLLVNNNIGVMAQPVFINSDIPLIENIIPKNAKNECYKYSLLLRRGLHVGMGTDCPVESYNPFINIYYAVGGADSSGKCCPGFEPMSIYEAIDSYTEGSAYLEFAENIKGRIKPGFYADMVLIDRDIFTCGINAIKEIKPLLTTVAGQIKNRGMH